MHEHPEKLAHQGLKTILSCSKTYVLDPFTLETYYTDPKKMRNLQGEGCSRNIQEARG